jgi:hypothetical protein
MVYYAKENDEVALVKQLLDEYSALGQTERLEILTSPFFHPILAILGNLGYEEDGIAQILLGFEKTRELFDVSPQGLWSPEETFNNAIIPMLNKTNVKYTILDDRLLADSYPSNTNRKPYYLADPNTQLQTIAFFRDSTISNNIAFNWNGFNDGDEAVREFLASLSEIYFTQQNQAVNEKIHVTLAVDGENWLTDNNLLERMYQVVHENSFLLSQTLEEQLADNPPEDVLWNLREGSWGRQTSLITWQGTPAKDWVWDQISRVRDRVLYVNATLPPANEYRQTMMFDYFISQGSDYTFWEETNPSFLALFAGKYANRSLILAEEISDNPPVIESDTANGTLEGENLLFTLKINNPTSEPLYVKLRFLLFNEGRVLIDDKKANPFEVSIGEEDYTVEFWFPTWVAQLMGKSFDLNVTITSGYDNFKIISKILTITIIEKEQTTKTTTTTQSASGFSLLILLLVLIGLNRARRPKRTHFSKLLK